MAFRDWEDVESSGALPLLILGKPYRILPLGHLDAIRLKEEFAAVGDGATPTVTNEEWLLALLGKNLSAMRADNVPDEAIVHAAVTAQAAADYGIDVAEQVWEHGPNPKALMAAIKAANNPVENSTTSPSTDEAESSTKPPASTRSTRSPRKQPSKKSPGKKSSLTRASSRRTSSPNTAST